MWQGASQQLDVGVSEDLYLTVPRGEFKKIEPAILVQEKIRAPVQAGQELGTLRVSLDGDLLAERPLVALGDVPKGGLWRRMSDYVRLWFQ